MFATVEVADTCGARRAAYISIFAKAARALPSTLTAAVSSITRSVQVTITLHRLPQALSGIREFRCSVSRYMLSPNSTTVCTHMIEAGATECFSGSDLVTSELPQLSRKASRSRANCKWLIVHCPLPFPADVTMPTRSCQLQVHAHGCSRPMQRHARIQGFRWMPHAMT